MPKGRGWKRMRTVLEESLDAETLVSIPKKVFKQQQAHVRLLKAHIAALIKELDRQKGETRMRINRERALNQFTTLMGEVEQALETANSMRSFYDMGDWVQTLEEIRSQLEDKVRELQAPKAIQKLMTDGDVAETFYTILRALREGNHTQADRLIKEIPSFNVKEFYRSVQAVKTAIETAEGIMP